MSFTIKHLRDVEDQAPGFGLGDHQEARFPQTELEAEQTGIGLVRVKPGMKQAFAHRHDEAEEIYVVVSGSGRLKLDDEVVEVGTMDAIRISPNIVRAFEGGPDGVEYLAFGPHHAKDGAIVDMQEFWGE